MLRFIVVGAVLAVGATAVVHAQHAGAPPHGLAGTHAAAPHGTTRDPGHAAPPTMACSADNVGPQSPRDINTKIGENAKATFAEAPAWNQMSLCNIHFHDNAEHKGAFFSNAAKKGAAGQQCQDLQRLTPEARAVATDLPKGACGGVQPGDTIEVHYVFTSCTDTAPGPTLGACSSTACKAPTLRVESQVLLVINSPALKAGPPAVLGAPHAYAGFGGAVKAAAGNWRPTAPPHTMESVQYRGSTTNATYDNVSTCSPLQVTWNVRLRCAAIDVRALDAWCNAAGSPFREKEGAGLKAIEGHPARKLVTEKKLLSKID